MANKYMLGYKGIFNRYTVRQNLRSGISIGTALLSLGVCVWLFFFRDFDQIASLLNRIIDVLLGCLPDLLGFCIGGYAILVAMNNLEKMPALLVKQEKRGLSYYINLSADFAMTLLIMSALLLFSYVIRFIVDINFSAANDIIGKIANLIVISLLIWATVLVVVMIMGTIANIFNTSIILQTVAQLANEEEKEGGDGGGFTEEIIYEIKSWFGSYTIKRKKQK